MWIAYMLAGFAISAVSAWVLGRIIRFGHPTTETAIRPRSILLDVGVPAGGGESAPEATTSPGQNR
jgi:hypothetical protein